MIVKGTLEELLKDIPSDKLKRGGDPFPFYEKYQTFKSYLDKNLHKGVTKAAIREEIKNTTNFDKIIWLNDHGLEHIKTVIERASQILDNGNNSDLNPREIFLLLNAIQVHDLGNFYGRVGHEQKITEAIGEGLSPILFDSTEVRYIKSIAQVHGGKIKYKDGSEDKNTIHGIKEEIVSDGYKIRQRVLASILRFADELADDKNRADTKLLNQGLVPRGSEIYHAYSTCLDTVRIDHIQKSVELHFKVPKDYLLKTFGKVVKNRVVRRYVIDEIFERVVKMHYERIYCSKFWRNTIDIEKIWAQIEFYSTHDEDVLNMDELLIHPDITFTLHDSEYPSNTFDIYKMCPELKLKNGKKLDGATLEAAIKKTSNSESSAAKKKKRTPVKTRKRILKVKKRK